VIRLLLVEDEDVAIENFEHTLELVKIPTELMIVRSRDSAISHLHQECFDLIVCDLSIPSEDGALDGVVSHGSQVHAAARDALPGVPAIFLTGFPGDRSVPEALSRGPVGDFYGQPNLPLVKLIVKGDTKSLLDCLHLYLRGLYGLQERVVESADGFTDDSMLLRASQHLMAKFHADHARLTSYGGASGAQVGKLDVTLPGGFTRTLVVKVQSGERVRREQTAFEEHVASRLSSAYYAPAVTPQYFGLRREAANCYAVASGGINLFELLREDPLAAADVVRLISKEHTPWTSEQLIRASNVGDLRRAKVRKVEVDDLIAERPVLANLEARVIELSECTCHGDLHGANVIVRDSGQPQLIDFGDVCVGPSALDPLTLELSVLFNSSGPSHGIEEPTGLRLGNWCDLDAYCSDSEFAPFIRACREWAYRMGDEQTVLVTAYVHAMRQLKYDDIPRRVALEIAEAAAREIH